jgi:hypothetical protein
MKKIAVSLVAISFLSTCLAQKIDLRLNLEKGETYIQNLVSDLTMDQKAGNNVTHANNIISYKLAYKVIDIQDSVFDLEVHFENMSMKIILPNGSQEFSSEKNDNKKDIISSIFSMMKNKTFYVKMTKTGKIKEVGNIDTLFIDALYKFPNVSDAEKQKLQGQLTQNFGRSSFKGYMNIFPEVPVGKGEKWTIMTQGEGKTGNMNETVYKLKEIGDSYYVLAGESKIKEAVNKTIQSNGISGNADVRSTGKMTSEIKINKTSGWIMSATMVMSFNVTALIKANSQTQKDIIIPMWVKNTITINEK